MSYELLYTSAARGLKPGSQGFCVVVSTQGLASNLADRLESLSGYRHVFPAQDAQAALNPIVWSHLRLSVAGRNYHVLSRIAAAGLDYTQRSNKIAHHIALETAELNAAGPAALLLAPGFMATDWDGQSRLLTQGRTVPAVTTAPAVCRAWQAATGDTGWGGVLAESATGPASRPVLLIFNPGTDVLSLMAESLALLPPERRWQVTFSSYYTRLPAGVDCQWRGLVAGSPEALAARHVPGALVIDLSRPLEPAKGGALVTAARTGRVVAEVKSSPGPAAPGLRTAEEPARAAGGASPFAAATAARRAAYPPLADIGIELGPPPQVSEPLWEPPITRKLTPKPKPRWPLWLALAVAVLLCLSSALAVWKRLSADKTVAQQDGHPRQSEQVSPHSDQTGSQRSGSDRPKVKPLPEPEVQSEPDEPEPTWPEMPESQPPDEPFPGDPTERPLFDPDPVPAEHPPVQPKPRGLDSVPAFVELPPIGGQQHPQALFLLPDAAVDYSLKLRGARMADGAQLVLKRDGNAGYSIQVEFNSAVGGSERIARLELRDQKLTFRWEPLKNADQRLRWRELKNQVLLVGAEGAGQRVVALRKPEPAAPLRLALVGRTSESGWDLDAPPAGDYSPQVWVGEKLSLSTRGQMLSVNLRSEPISTPVKMAVEVVPAKVFTKHTLQTRLKGTVRLTYRGVHISREHLKADDPHAFEPTPDPEPITPDVLRTYMSSLSAQINADIEKLKALPPPPGAGSPPSKAPPPGKTPPPGTAPPPGSGPPPTDAQLQERRQLEQSIHRDKEHLRQAAGLNRLLVVLESGTFDFRVFCDIDGHPVCVVSTSDSGAPLVSSAGGP